jgi:carboxyl-terminal processing protease
MNKFYRKKRVFLLIVGILVTGFFISESDIYFKIAKSIDTFGKVYRQISINYVDKINPEKFMRAGIRGMLSSLDPYTIFIDETMKKDFDVITTGKYGGIGTSVGLRRGKVTILELMEGYPAQRQGLRVGDVILKIDSVEINKNNYDNLSNYLKGNPGKTVTLTVERDGVKGNLIFELVLEEIVIKNVPYFGFIPKDGNTAYIKLSGFSRSAGSEVKNALITLKKKKKIDSIILDLRGNPGGLLDQAIDVAEKFLDKNKLIVSVIGRDTTKIVRYLSEESPIAGKSKLVVLINDGSASASEIVTGAIKDHDRGVVIGEKSFGKGLVQTILPLSFNTSLKITTARYYTPSGRCIQKINYSDNKDIFDSSVKRDTGKFFTDNKREVFANGGIMPDSVVSNISESKQVEILLGRGMFFRFATNYFNTHTISEVEEADSSELYSEFIKYLKEHNFDYTSESEKLLKELEKIAKDEKLNSDILPLLTKLKDAYQKDKMVELERHKSEIVYKIKEELAARISGKEGRILQGLKHDKQFNVALSVLADSIIYNKLLGLKN